MAASHQLSCSLGKRDTRNLRTNVFFWHFSESHQSVLGPYQGINDSDSDSDSDSDVVEVTRARVSFKPIVAAPALVIP
jgi:hypothetical protein